MKKLTICLILIISTLTLTGCKQKEISYKENSDVGTLIFKKTFNY